MSRNWAYKGRALLPWNPTDNIKQVVNTKAVKEFRGTKVNLAVFSVKWQDAVASLYDFASNGRLGGALTAKFGAPSRVMWYAMDQQEGRVEQEMLAVIEDVMAQVSKRLVTVEGS